MATIVENINTAMGKRPNGGWRSARRQGIGDGSPRAFEQPSPPENRLDLLLDVVAMARRPDTHREAKFQQLPRMHPDPQSLLRSDRFASGKACKEHGRTAPKAVWRT